MSIRYTESNSLMCLIKCAMTTIYGCKPILLIFDDEIYHLIALPLQSVYAACMIVPGTKLIK